MPSIRKPRFKVTVNGTLLTGVLEAEVTNASHFTADTYRVTAAVSGLPEAFSPAYWALSASDQISISAGFADASEIVAPNNWTQLILGQVDEVVYDPIDRLLTLTGRDLSAPMIDTKTSEKFQNKTSSEIAQDIAKRHGLTASVQKTTTKAGVYYNLDHVHLTQEQTEWDLLMFLAQNEGFDLWVSGNTLNFMPSPVATAKPYKLLCPPPKGANNPSNATNIKVSRSQTLARDVIVRVRTWNQRQQRGFTVESHRSQAFKSARGGGKAQIYSIIRANLTQVQAQKLADSLAEDITRHEKILTATLPGDNLLTTRSMVQLSGSGTAWDQKYYPDSVTRRLSFNGGYEMELRAKNHSTQSTVLG